MICAIGDIHGYLRKLERLVAKIEDQELTEADRLVFVGDYIDRGPSSCGVIDNLIELKRRRPNTIFLRGNHDQTMLDARDVFGKTRQTDKTFESINWWFSYGGRETIDSYPPGSVWYKRISQSHWEFLEATEMEYREGNYVFVHAGLVPPGQVWKNHTDPRLWIREPFIGSDADFGAIVVFGHTAQKNFIPLIKPNKVGIDTAASYGGPLTALLVEPDQPYDGENLTFLSSL